MVGVVCGDPLTLRIGHRLITDEVEQPQRRIRSPPGRHAQRVGPHSAAQRDPVERAEQRQVQHRQEIAERAAAQPVADRGGKGADGDCLVRGQGRQQVGAPCGTALLPYPLRGGGDRADQDKIRQLIAHELDPHLAQHDVTAVLLDQLSIGASEISDDRAGLSAAAVRSSPGALLADLSRGPGPPRMASAVLELRDQKRGGVVDGDTPDVLGNVDDLVLVVEVIQPGQPLNSQQLALGSRFDEGERPARSPPEVEIVSRVGLRRPHISRPLSRLVPAVAQTVTKRPRAQHAHATEGGSADPASGGSA